MKKFLSSLLLIGTLILTGCAKTTMESDTKSEEAKKFINPSKAQSGLYIYRDQGFFGAALKKSLYVDDKFIGESAPNVFFHKVVDAGKHKISTESEFGKNDLNLTTEGGKNYFIRQYIRMGVFVGGANLEQVSEEKGKVAIQKLKLAKTQ